MELLKQLQDLEQQKKLTEEELLKITSTEELKLLLEELMSAGKGDRNNLLSFFDELRELTIKDSGMNIFQEHLTLKFFYLKQVYGVEEVCLYSLMELMGPVVLDYYLETEVVNDDKFYLYYVNKYQEYKNNNEFTIFKLLDRLDIKDLKLEGEELQKLVDNMAKLADTSSEKTN